MITNAVITAVSGEKKVEEVTLNNGTQLKTDAVFVAVGMIPHTEHLKNLLELDTQGYVVAVKQEKHHRKASLWQVMCVPSICVRSLPQSQTAPMPLFQLRNISVSYNL